MFRDEHFQDFFFLITQVVVFPIFIDRKDTKNIYQIILHLLDIRKIQLLFFS